MNMIMIVILIIMMAIDDINAISNVTFQQSTKVQQLFNLFMHIVII